MSFYSECFLVRDKYLIVNHESTSGLVNSYVENLESHKLSIQSQKLGGLCDES